jgi:drug/metabolite transporter (DMT)-like permease
MWQWYALAAMVCYAAMQVLFVQLTRRGASPAAILLVVFSVAALCFAGYVGMMRTPLRQTGNGLLLLVVAAVLSFVGNLCSLRAMSLAPNPGYASAISGVHALVVTLLAIAVFGLTVSWTKLLGVVLCVLGAALLLI